MRRVLILLFLFISTGVYAQVIGPVNEQFNTIRQNGVSTIAAFGDTVWVSPQLNRNIGNSIEWYTPENADSVTGEGVGRVYSLALGQDTVLAGLGYTADTESGPLPFGYGYYKSVNGGQNWEFEPLFLDPRGEGDTTFTYGGQSYERIRIAAGEQSPAYEIDFQGDVILSANWASGLLRSRDFGESWERVILPPSDVEELTPERNDYYWTDCTDRDGNNNCVESNNKYDPVDDDNLKGFGVMIDSRNRVWFGSAGGINISENALTAPTDSISWRHIRYDGSNDGLLGNWIITIREEPGSDRIWMTNWIQNTPQKEGIVYTDDDGETFTQMLIGERINDIGFKDGYVFAAGDDGLFVSSDEGDTWIKLPRLESPNTFIKSSAFYYSVASTPNRLWIGTSDGIASIECCSANQQFNNWQITRVNYPLKGGNVHEPDGRNTNTYAYPNPFSASVYDLVRMKFEVKKQGNVRVRIFDFGMNLVREVENDSFSPGTYEAVWDGYDGQGRKVANGTYIYIVETAGRELSGKILVVD